MVSQYVSLEAHAVSLGDYQTKWKFTHLSYTIQQVVQTITDIHAHWPKMCSYTLSAAADTQPWPSCSPHVEHSLHPLQPCKQTTGLVYTIHMYMIMYTIMYTWINSYHLILAPARKNWCSKFSFENCVLYSTCIWLTTLQCLALVWDQHRSVLIQQETAPGW